MSNTHDDDQLIYDSVIACNTRFQRLLTDVTRRDARHSAIVRDHYLRFEHWAEFIGALADEQASLDNRLRPYPEVRDLVLQMLQMLDTNLKHVLHFEAEAIATILLPSNDVTGKKDPPGITENVPRPVNIDEVKKRSAALASEAALEAIQEAMDRLHRLAIVIRRSSASSFAPRVKGFALQTDADENAELDRLILLRLKGILPGIGESLARQLVESISHRRLRLLYQRRHQKKLGRRRPVHPPQGQSSEVQEEKHLPPPSMQTNEVTGENKTDGKASVCSKSQAYSDTAHSGLDLSAFQLHHTEDLVGIPDNTTVTSVAQDYSYPSPPVIQGSAKSTRCNWCFEEVLASQLQIPGWWRAHFKRDLQPYVCISEDCTEPAIYFTSFSQWRKHMDQVHTANWARQIHAPKAWYCDLDPDEYNEFRSADDFRKHITSHRDASFTENQLTRKLAHDLTTANHQKMAMHVASHLKSLALLSIRYIDDDSASAKSEDAALGVDADASDQDRLSVFSHSDSPLEFQDIPLDERLHLDEKASVEGELGKMGFRPSGLRPAVSALARQTIKTAYDELDRTITPRDKRDFGNTTLENVQKAALDLENQLAARQSLRNMRRLMPLFRGLEHYSKVVDTLCSGTPFLPWIWAPITLILRIASEYVEAFEKIIKGYSNIAESLKRFEILSDAFIRESEFQETVAVFYADILQFHKHAYKFVRRIGWKLTFLTSWGRFERRFDNILEDLKQHGRLIDQEANARNITEAKKMREDIRAWREESQGRVRHDETEQSAKQFAAIASWLKINESDQLAIFDSISSEAAGYQGTYEWILKNPKVRSWARCEPDTPALWLRGSAGTGKSVLCTQLVNFMKASNIFVVCHFCSYLYASSTAYEQILKSLLLQLVRKDGDLVAHVYGAYVLQKKLLTTTALEQLFQTLLANMSDQLSQVEYALVIVDGLDECEPDKQTRLIRLINQITSKPSLPGSTVCKVLLSSRAPSNALQSLKRKQTISLTDEKNSLQGAIGQYVGQRLRSLDTRLRQLDIGEAEIEEIRNVIVEKADGMFLYARLVMDHLASNIFYSGHEIKQSVNQLPKKLADFYHKTLAQIVVRLDSRSVDRIRCILGWVAFAKRPLQKLEFLSAITFSPGDPGVDRLAPQYILDICGTLIEERRDSTLAFIHISVKEFLQSSSSSVVINKQEALHEQGVATVACLLSGWRVFSSELSQQERYLRIGKGLHGFHVYATEYWTEYLLSHAAGANGFDTASPPPLIVLACQLADEVADTSSAAAAENDMEMSKIDERLTSLRQYSALHKCVGRALKARSLKSLEARIYGERGERMKVS
ncbi:hypothetical protein ACHAPT_011852 [Fusarium lateritium]